MEKPFEFKHIVLLAESPPFSPLLYDSKNKWKPIIGRIEPSRDDAMEIGCGLHAVPTGGLDCFTTVPLDARHGVFPNHVMTPLLATLFCTEKAKRSTFFEKHIGPILEASLSSKDNDRMFNVFTHPFPERFKPRKNKKEADRQKIKREICNPVSLDKNVIQLFARPEKNNPLFIVIGIWPTLGIFYHLITRKEEVKQTELETFGERITAWLNTKMKNYPETQNFLETQKRPPLILRLGLYFRLFNFSETSPVLLDLVNHLVVDHPNPSELEQKKVQMIVRSLHSLIPIPHNEAYQNKPTGKSMNLYMTCSPDKKSPHGSKSSSSVLLWQYIGQAIATRFHDGVFLKADSFPVGKNESEAKAA